MSFIYMCEMGFLQIYIYNIYYIFQVKTTFAQVSNSFEKNGLIRIRIGKIKWEKRENNRFNKKNL